jgi:hypothetical protein
MTIQNTNPIFIQRGLIGAAEISAANTGRDGTGTVVTILTGDLAGSRIDQILVVAEGTTTAGMIRLFLHDGTTFFLFEEITVSALTPDATTKAFSGSAAFTFPIILPDENWTLRASTEKAETFNVMAFGGHYG